jgi:uncharacterized protein involved in exopolysaccharide biosynthesis
MDALSHEHSQLRDYLQVLRRRKWIVLTAVVVVPVAAYLFSTQQQSKYRATAEVLLSRQNLSQSLNGVQDPTLSIQPDRLAQTQADLARVPPVVERTLRVAHADITPAEFAAESSVSAKTDADLLTFQYTHHDAALAARLATEYARQYITYRAQLDTQALTKAAAIAKVGALPANQQARVGTLLAIQLQQQQKLAAGQATRRSNCANATYKAAHKLTCAKANPLWETAEQLKLGELQLVELNAFLASV